MASLLRRHPASFRDPSGFVFSHDHKIYRQVNRIYKDDFELFLKTGLYDALVAKNNILSHSRIDQNFTGTADWYCTLLPEQLPFISYPFEWCFGMLKEAALLTLDVAEQAIAHGMILKDASAFNIQWYNGKMTLIDSLSFEKYDSTLPWVAYSQFCEHFLAPLSFMHYLKEPAHSVLSGKIEGLPLSMVKKTLPFRSKFNLHIYLHLHLQAALSGKKLKDEKGTGSFSSTKLRQLLKSLQLAVESCKFVEERSNWSHYYEEASERDDYLDRKKEVVERWVKDIDAETAIDVGANEGSFSSILANQNIYTISIDGDHAAINRLYNNVRKKGIKNIHPIVMDITNPSPGIGWNNEERISFLQRIKTDLVLALAVIHHLAIGKNVPLPAIAKLCAGMGRTLIIEFVPKEDEKVQFMLRQRKDIFDNYSEKHFLEAFGAYYKITSRQPVGHSGRTLYLMQVL